MSIDRLNDILGLHADALNARSPEPLNMLAEDSPEEWRELTGLFKIAERAKRALSPVSPSPAFRARLRDGLMLAAHHQQTRRILTEKRGEPTWGWLIGAAAIGSAAGIVAFVLRLRAQSHRLAPSAETRSG
jgi:hypothetical protein